MRYFIARVLFLLTTCWVSSTSAAPNYRIVPLGFDDLEHTRDDGYKSSVASDLNEVGHVRGYSLRFNGGSIDLGQSAWLYDGATTVNIGFNGPEHTRNDDYKYSAADELNEAGKIRGYSLRYNGGSNDLGRSAWLFNGATTVDIGLTGAEHTRDDNYRYSVADDLNEVGQVRGYSLRYNGDSANLGRSVWVYDGANTIDIGLAGAEHTRNDGYKDSVADDLNQVGQVRGSSQRFNGGNASLGQSAWLYDRATTVDIGLVDGEHTRDDGYKVSFTDELNEAGRVLGHSFRYNGGNTILGFSTWLYDGSATVKIGLIGSEHTRNDGYKNSLADELNEAGYVRGVSTRYNGGGTNLGQSVWLYNGAATIDIGLTGSEYTRSNGFKRSRADEMNAAGQVRGYSERYNGGTLSGYSAWLYNGATTLNIGLTDSEHTQSTGFRNSSTIKLNEAGQVAGHSIRYNGSNDYLGQSAWLYNGATTFKIGLTDSEHTTSNGVKFSEAEQLNEAGKVRGSSDRYDAAGVNIGQSAWLYDGTTTVKIGLNDAEHTGSGGYKSSRSKELNETEQVIGTSERYNGGFNYRGSSAWLYNGATTVKIGLTGSEQTRNDGYLFNSADELNKAGQVRGYAERYNGSGTLAGRDAWFYDPTLDQTFPLQLSTRSDGYAYSSATYLGDDGLTLGIYNLFDALDNNLGFHAFYFTVADGLYDLGSVVDGGLTANGWDYLANTIHVNGLGQILGRGKLASQASGGIPFLLTTTVPEPSTLALAALATVGLILPRWRRVW